MTAPWRCARAGEHFAEKQASLSKYFECVWSAAKNHGGVREVCTESIEFRKLPTVTRRFHVVLRSGQGVLKDTVWVASDGLRFQAFWSYYRLRLRLRAYM